MRNINFLNKLQRNSIGFDYILDNLELSTCFGIEEKKNIRPYSRNEKQALLQELENIQQVIYIIQNYPHEVKSLQRLLKEIKDIRGSISKFKSGSIAILDDVELYEIKNFALVIEDIIDIYIKINIHIEGLKLLSLKNIIQLLNPKDEISTSFSIYEEYSPNLRSIRKKKREIEKKIVAEKTIDKKNALRQQRLEIVVLEQKEELSIRETLSKELSSVAETINQNIKAISILDLTISKAYLAIKLKATKPVISEERKIILNKIFNPKTLQILHNNGKEYVPVSIELNDGATVITGANMAGKSLTIKTIVLNLLLGQMGFYTFGEYCQMPMLDYIYLISEDLQSMDKGLSTFGGEIFALNEVVLATKSGNGFVGLDELARGTNPKEGHYLVKSLCEFFMKKSVFTVISTHYDDVVQSGIAHYQVVGLKNLNLQLYENEITKTKGTSIDIINELIDYRLEKVSESCEVPRDALNIARLLGLDEEIIKIADKYYKGE